MLTLLGRLLAVIGTTPVAIAAGVPADMPAAALRCETSPPPARAAAAADLVFDGQVSGYERRRVARFRGDTTMVTSVGVRFVAWTTWKGPRDQQWVV